MNSLLQNVIVENNRKVVWNFGETAVVANNKLRLRFNTSLLYLLFTLLPSSLQSTSLLFKIYYLGRSKEE